MVGSITVSKMRVANAAFAQTLKKTDPKQLLSVGIA
jgi:hypothetical protein